MSKPIESLSGNERITVPAHLLSVSSGDHYVLRVVGDSMRNEGLQDGDYVVILRRSEAQSGEMVIVIVGDKGTIKRYYLDGDKVRLQSFDHENPAKCSSWVIDKLIRRVSKFKVLLWG